MNRTDHFALMMSHKPPVCNRRLYSSYEIDTGWMQSFKTKFKNKLIFLEISSSMKQKYTITLQVGTENRFTRKNILR